MQSCRSNARPLERSFSSPATWESEPPACWFRRGPLQIELQRALCQVRSGDSSAGTDYATTTLDELPTEHRTRFVMGLGEQVLAAVPPGQRRIPTARELHELLRDDAFGAQRAIEQ